MAKVLYGGVGLQGLSGSINKQAGGHTFTKNNVVRRRVNPTNPQTDAQQAVRNGFSNLTTAWSSLTEEERTAWEAARTQPYYAKQDSLYGVTRAITSGKSLFIAMNQNYRTSQGTPDASAIQFSTPGETAGTDDITNVAVAADATANTVTLTFDGDWTDEAGIFSATPCVPAGTMKRTSVNNLFRVVDAPIDAGSPFNLSAAYLAKFGVLNKGYKIFWQLSAVDLGTGKMRTVASGVTVVTV